MERELTDIAWLLFCAMHIFLMQAGFICLESGLTRSKNNINVAMKNLTDFALSVLLFWAFGFALVFGDTKFGLFGTGMWFYSGSDGAGWHTAFFIFQMMFCATASTIFSGAVAERMRYAGYIIVTIILSGMIYPIFAHWTWNGADTGESTGWLGALGFVDFAGAATVHCAGGWVALAALIVIGPREGRFGRDKNAQPFSGSDVPFSVLGVVLLWIGWLGFNGGSTFSLTPSVTTIVVNTLLAGASGGLAALAAGSFHHGRANVMFLINGSLAGLVAITATCFAVMPIQAAFIGCVGGLVMLVAESILIHFEIDDAVGAVPVHLAGGIWGTVAVGMFADPEILATGLGRLAQTGVQILGIAVCGIWAYGISYVILRFLNNKNSLRVSAHAEKIGLNISEHGAASELYNLMSTMDTQTRTRDLSLRIECEPFTEIGQIAQRYNQVMDGLEKATQTADFIFQNMRDGIITITRGGLLTSFNPGAERIFGYPAADVVGHPTSKLLVTAGGGRLCGFDDLLNCSNKTVTTTPSGDALFGRRMDQSMFPIELSISEGESQEGTVYTGLVRDITERVKIEKTAETYMSQLEKERSNLARARSDLEHRVEELQDARRATLNILQDHQRMTRKAEDAQKRFRSLNTSSPIGIFEADADGNLIYANPRWESITQLEAQMVKGHEWMAFVHQDDREAVDLKWQNTIMQGRELEMEFRFQRRTDGVCWVHFRSTVLRRDDGKKTGYVGTLEDITDRKIADEKLKQSLKEKEVLLREIHHRVKNNLQIISSLLNMQSRQLTDSVVRDLFDDSQHRVRTMALIHEKLYQSDGLTLINFDQYLRNLTTHLFRSYATRSPMVNITVTAENVFLSIDTAIPCGLIVNELTSNSLKYAFPDQSTGEIRVRLIRSDDGRYNLTVADSGIGFPEDVDFRDTATLGLQLVNTLAKQLGAEITLSNHNGACFDLIFRDRFAKKQDSSK